MHVQFNGVIRQLEGSLVVAWAWKFTAKTYGLWWIIECRPSVRQSMGPCACASSCRPASCLSKIGHMLRNSHVYRMARHTCAAPQSPGLHHVAFCIFKQNMDQQMPPRHVLDAGEPWHDRVHQRPKTRGVNLACILQKSCASKERTRTS